MKNTTQNRLLAGALAFGAFIGLNIFVSQFTNSRLDLTEDGLYTLSPGTVKVLAALETAVEINFYYSPELGEAVPQYASYATRVRDMLAEFKSIAGDNLIINEQNPEPFSEIEDGAVEDGMQGIPLEAAGEKVYFGVAGKSPKNKQMDLDLVRIPFFQIEREQFMELDLAKIVYRLANPDIPKVGIITGAEVFGSYQAVMQGLPPTPWTAISQVQEIFLAEQIYSAEKLIEYNPEILLLIHPADLTDEMLYAIDQYLLAGGKAVFYVDPFFETAQNPNQGMVPVGTESNMNKLFNAWGVDVAEDIVVGDKGNAAMVNSGDQTDVVPLPYILWMQLTPENLNPEDVITADVKNMVLASAGRLVVDEDSPLKVEPLILSTDQSMEIVKEKAEDPDLSRLLKDFQPGGENMLLAARLSGEVKTAFPDGPPQPEKIETHDGEAAKPQDKTTEIEWAPHQAQSTQPMNIIIVTDADMLVDRFWVRVQNFFGQQIAVPVADNGTFLVNALDSLVGSGDLITLRSRGTGQRRFKRIVELEKAAEEKFRATERALSEKITEVEAQISTMQGGADGQLEGEEKTTLDTFTEELLATRKQLRDVNHSLRKDVEAMEGQIRFINIALIPLLVAIFAFVAGYIRLRRRRRI